MKLPKPSLEAALLCLSGCGLLFLSPPGIHLRFLSPIDNAYLWQRAGVLAALLFGYGSALVALAIWSQVLCSSGTSLGAQICRYAGDVCVLIRNVLFDAVRRAFRSGGDVAWLAVVLCLGVAVRAYFLSQPMRYDESNTFLHFVNGDISLLFFYPFPNNHVLHTILVKLSTWVFGAHPSTIRFPAFFAGIASIPLMFCLARALFRESSAAFATVAMAIFPYLILYSTMARGYTLVVFFTLTLIFVGALTAEKPSIAASAVLSVIAALGLLTIPSMAFAVAGVYLWLTCLLLINGNKLPRILREFVIPCAIMTVALTAVFYTPVILVSKGLDTLLANEYVAAQPSEVFFRQLYPHLALTLSDFFRDVPSPVLVVFLALMAIGAYSAAQRSDWAVLLLLPSALAACAFLLLFKHAIPYPRTWIFLLPLMLILADGGWAHCVETLSHGIQKRLHRGIVFAGACYGVWLISANAIVQYPDTGTFPDAARIVRYLKPLMKEGDKVRASIPADYPLYFYLWYYNLRGFRGEAEPDQTEFFVVQKSNYRFESKIDEPVVKLVAVADAAVYRNVPEDEQRRHERPG